jgi:hypothetical protein
MQVYYPTQDHVYMTPPMVEAPYGHGIMEPYYGPTWGFIEPPTHVITLPHCKVCEDAGKSPMEFHNHWVRESREPDAKVTCPLLLSQKCNYCKKKGHTIKYCERLKKKEHRMRNTSLEHSYPIEEGEVRDNEDDTTRTMSTVSEDVFPIVGN